MPFVLKLTDSEKDRVLALLSELVKINSAVVNTAQANRDRAEQRIAEFLSEHLRKMGMTVQRQEVFPGRPNLIAHWPGQGGGRRLMLEAHQDTVGVQGMTVDPFTTRIVEGKIYGRGACDAKGAMAAFVTALTLAHESGRLPADKLYFVATMSEETGCDGAAALMEDGFRTEAAIVGEPTACQLVTAHKGPLWLEIETRGQPGHASVPQEGANAIDLMTRVVQFVNGPWREFIQRQRHPLLGPSTAAVTMIEGGSMINVIPAQCRAKIDGRFVPGAAPEQILADFKRMLGEYLGDEQAWAVTWTKSHPALDSPPDAPLAAKLLDICRRANGQRAPKGVQYFADSGPFSQAGITAVLFGPGHVSQAHKADEYLELAQLFQATEIILTLLTEHAGRAILL